MPGSILLFGGASLAMTAGVAYATLRLARRDRARAQAMAAAHAQVAALQAMLEPAPAGVAFGAGDPSDLAWLTRAAAAADDALWEWDCTRDLIRFSPRWRQLLGLAAEAVERPIDEWWNRVHPSDRAQLHVDLTAARVGGSARLSIEHRVRHEDGRWLHLHWHGTVARDDGGRAVRVSGHVRDVTAIRVAEERRRHDALYDALTGLPNRTLALDLLQRAILRARRHGERTFAVMLVDLDRFNLLNDSLGHAAGDALLAAVAERLATAVRPGDVIARLGGDEFLLLLDDVTSIEDAEGVADRVKLVLADPILAISHEVHVTASIGIVLHDPAVEEPVDYLRDAELAMHGAKAAGRARHHRFSIEMRDGVRRRVSMEQDLRGAIDRQEFVVLFQPVWSVADGGVRLLGFEALVRWLHPRKGMLAAGDFIPIAEESDLIIGLGTWAMHRACRELAEMAPNGPSAPWVSVNLAARQLADRGLVGRVEEVLHATGLEPARLRLEVTENVILHDEAGARQMLEALRALGIRSLMDDFGTGHASLSYLHRLPIGTIKIDRYFVGRMDVSPECLEIVRSIVALARSLGMEVVAEGVEQEAQLAQLRELGCSAVQGFLLARPLLGEEAIALIAALEHAEAADARAVLRELGLGGTRRHSLEVVAVDEAAIEAA